ncbi:MAG: LysR family transcriptional regulator [Cyanobacteria bacterium P01_E01_bin.45]
MDIESLRVFIEVARRGSFAAVARDRNLDPSSISRIVSLLEDSLGFRLFQRTTRRMALTAEGEHYLNRIANVVEELDRARDEILTTKESPAGTLRLTTSVALGQIWLVPLLPQFRSQFPHLKLELRLCDTNLDLVSERIDLAIRLAPRITTDLERIKLFNTRYRICASPGYLDRATELSEPRDLERHRCLLFNLPGYRSLWIFRSATGERQEIGVDGDIVVSSALALRECALAGLGPALLADWAIGDDLAAGRLRDVFPTYDVTATEFRTAAWMVYPSRSFLPQKVRIMMEFLQDHAHTRTSDSRST